ncbi:hydroxyectoine utilization dehydratase EutB [Mesorhizobium sp. B4-1-4]|uniref:hydroxyectoine utilization dehydratase EutB n=1 Tax=Mesorhizobium sp. B4-1-4 TaxID=2589888 RepID=UPI00112A1907|nr:hydroxyectoine utilization dehydratase EutB [Mesorhizobium sp. B4-1-4]UCI31955.1 hydroxyectoine utilization dehydratase EutB [Mesorhizobium sp. B4-1-4]
MTSAIDLDSIHEARERIATHIRATPLVTSLTLSQICGTAVGLKLEHRQATGSFKLRGATNAVLQLSETQRERGVVAVSTGNHGRALAYAARAVGSQATICMSSLVPENKVTEIQRLGAEVRIVGNSQDEAQEEVGRLVADGMVIVPPFDHPDVIAGQGTIGLEIVESVPDVDIVLVGLSGGGLAAGVATALKSLRPSARFIGISMTRGAAMKASLSAGKPVLVAELPTLADALGGGIGLENRWTFPMCQKLLDDVIVLSEEEIAAGIRHAYEEEREIVEGSGAVGIAALLARKIPKPRGPVVVVVSGGNIDMNLHRSVINSVPNPLRWKE